jgi:hypothetical protein
MLAKKYSLLVPICSVSAHRSAVGAYQLDSQKQITKLRTGVQDDDTFR